MTGFFDNLDHVLLKDRLKRIFSFKELSDDLYKVFRFLTRFHYVELSDLQAHPVFGPRLRSSSRDRIASVEEIKKQGIIIRQNPNITDGFRSGIPQGTPISAAASNLYMINFDKDIAAYCKKFSAMYRRYSDDILIVCKPEDQDHVLAEVNRLIAREKLVLSPSKTEITHFSDTSIGNRTSKAAQYLGFTLDEGGAAIRESSLARQWRKMKHAIRRTRRVAVATILTGKADRAYTKKLYKRFTFLKIRAGSDLKTIRNFSAYARRSADSFNLNKKIRGQVRRLELASLNEIQKLKKIQSCPEDSDISDT